MKHFSRWIAIVMMVFAAFALSAAPRDGIEVRLSVFEPVLHGDINVTVTNTTRHPVNLLCWQLPSENVPGRFG